MRCGFFVPGRSVDLTGEKQPAQALRFERASQLCRLNEVVFDGVTGPENDRVLQTRKCVNEIGLNIARQTHREAVDVDLTRFDAFRLQENLMSFAIRKANDLVFERRAVPRTDPVDLTVEQRRSRQIPSHDFPHAIVRM